MAKKILLITNIPNPYRIPLFNELNKQLARREIQLKVIFGASGYPRRKWHIDFSDFQFEYEILPSKSLKFLGQEKIMFTYPGLYKRISTFDPNVVITNAFSIASTKLWLRSIVASKYPYIIWSGAINRQGESDNLFRIWQRRALIKRASGYISYGSKARQYLIDLGAIEANISIAFNTVDTEFYANETSKIKKELKTDGKYHLLYIGHFTKGKRLDLLLQVMKQLVTLRHDFILDLVGTGPEENNLKEVSAKWGIEKYVLFHGFHQKKELPIYFARADCFLFPSEYDVWGLVLVEAMAAGVPCISSIYAGATCDLIQNEVNGFAVDFEDFEIVANKINWMLENPDKRRVMGENAKKLILNKITINQAAKKFLEAIQKVNISSNEIMN